MHLPSFLLPRAADAVRGLFSAQILDATHPDVGGIVASDDSSMQDEGFEVL